MKFLSLPLSCGTQTPRRTPVPCRYPVFLTAPFCNKVRALRRSRLLPYMMVQGIGMQQHSKSPQSIHRVLPPVASAGLTMLSNVEDAALPGPLWLTRDEWDEPQDIFFQWSLFSVCISLFYSLPVYPP
ncbi:hypothetical protein HD806DRAFT_65992 [Xylariaceae sp. AK1471]|nr:hypothetical protein HD806DRAFT_65992 [Xylariaceae sp. AK1471]